MAVMASKRRASDLFGVTLTDETIAGNKGCIGSGTTRFPERKRTTPHDLVGSPTAVQLSWPRTFQPCHAAVSRPGAYCILSWGSEVASASQMDPWSE